MPPSLAKRYIPFPVPKWVSGAKYNFIVVSSALVSPYQACNLKMQLEIAGRETGTFLLTCTHRNKFSRLMMPLVLSRGILLRPRSKGSNMLGLGLYLHS